MKPVDANKLREIIDSEIESEYEQMLYKDVFSTGCFLHKKGHHAAARTLCYGVLKSLGYDKRKTYFSQLLGTLSGNEDAYAECMWAHNEINDLFDN